MRAFYLTLRINPCFFQQFLKISLKAKEDLIHLSKKKNVELFLDICGDKPVNEYNSDDYEKFQVFLIQNNFNAKHILSDVVEVILTGYENLNIKEKINFRKKSKNKVLNQSNLIMMSYL